MCFYIQADQDRSVLWMSVMQIMQHLVFDTQIMVWKLDFACFNAKLLCQERLSAFYFGLQGEKNKKLNILTQVHLGGFRHCKRFGDLFFWPLLVIRFERKLQSKLNILNLADLSGLIVNLFFPLDIPVLSSSDLQVFSPLRLQCRKGERAAELGQTWSIFNNVLFRCDNSYRTPTRLQTVIHLEADITDVTLY